LPAAILLLRRPCLIRRNRSLIVHWLSLALLFAQFGIAVHASTHLKPDSHPASAQLCGHCLSFSPLQNMVGGGAIALPAVDVAQQHSFDSSIGAVAPRQPFTAFRSRGPPYLL
jgi:disulfide bond formation protein DsbB